MIEVRTKEWEDCMNSGMEEEAKKMMDDVLNYQTMLSQCNQ